MSNLNKVYGIDLGTTYSCIANVDETERPSIIPNLEGKNITASVIFFDDDTSNGGTNIIVGETAKDYAEMTPDNVVQFIKRQMGKSTFYFEHNDIKYRPEELSSFILRKIAGDAEKYLGEEVKDVVITCPAYFGEAERQATKEAGEIAGLNVLTIINEPTAAALAYAYKEREKGLDKTVLVYDLGGGTFDITVIKLTDDEVKVITTGGDHNLGGKDWDDKIINHLVSKFQDITGVPEELNEIYLDKELCQYLRGEAEKAKKTLTNREKTRVKINYKDESENIEITRDEFDNITANLLERTMMLTRETIEDAKAKGVNYFDEILLVGGSTRMPQISRRIEEEYDRRPKCYEPDEAIAKGAAIYGKNKLLELLIKEETGKTASEIKALPTNERRKVTEEIKMMLPGEYDIEEVIESYKEIINVVSKSYGIHVIDENDRTYISNIIIKNTEIREANVKKRYYTHANNQTVVRITVVEDELKDENIELISGKIIHEAALNIITNLPMGSPIDVTFNVTEEGLLKIKAEDVINKSELITEVSIVDGISSEEKEIAKDRGNEIEIS